MSKTIGDHLASVAREDCVAYRRDRAENDQLIEETLQKLPEKSKLIHRTKNKQYILF